MNQRWLLNLGLLLVIAVLALVVAFEPGKQKEAEIKLTEVDPKGVVSLSLKHKETMAFEKRDGRWWLSAPFAAPANEFRVTELINIATAKSFSRYPIKAEELKQFELDAPKAELTVGGVVMSFGGSDPLESRRYVKVGDTLHLVADDFYHHLIASAADFVERKLLVGDSNLVELQLPDFKLKRADGKWVFDPASDQAGPGDQLVGEWRNARAIEVRKLEQGKPIVGPAVRLVAEDGSSVEFIVTQRDPDLWLARKDWGLQYQIVGETGKLLLSYPKKPQEKPAEEPGKPDATGKQSGGEESGENPDDADSKVDAEGAEDD